MKSESPLSSLREITDWATEDFFSLQETIVTRLSAKARTVKLILTGVKMFFLMVKFIAQILGILNLFSLHKKSHSEGGEIASQSLEFCLVALRPFLLRKKHKTLTNLYSLYKKSCPEGGTGQLLLQISYPWSVAWQPTRSRTV